MTKRPGVSWTRRGSRLVLLLGILLVPLVALFDVLAGPEFGFSLFYLIPIVLVARFGSRTSAWLTAVLATLAWMIIDVLTTTLYTTFLAPLWNTLTRFAFFSFALIAVRSFQKRLVSAELRALSDPLTGLPNRQYLLIMLGAARARLERYRRPLTLAYLDVDDFKGINDLHGHLAGDEVLRSVARILHDCIRESDTVARVGGDEFLILLPEASSDTVRDVLERVRLALNGITTASGQAVGFSIGACIFYRQLESTEAMIRLADERMYAVKRSGKNRIAVAEVH